MSSAPDILIIEDHPMMVNSLRACLRSLRPDITIATATDMRQTEDLVAKRGVPRMFIVDLNLPDSLGLDTLQRVKKLSAAAPIIVFSAVDDEETEAGARQMGAHRYVAKTCVTDEFTEEVGLLLNAVGLQQPASRARVDTSRIAELTERRLRVLAELASGLGNREIAERLDISLPTVRSHVTAILKELGMQNRTQACIAYLRWASENGVPQ